MNLRRRSVLTGLAAASFCPICLAREASADKAAAGPAWSYGGATGPAKWGELAPSYAACSVGSQQSPVDLAGATGAALPPLAINWHASRCTMENNTHTISVKLLPGQNNTVVEGDGPVFTLAEFHFHHMSEHVIGSTRHLIEAHFVHTNEATVLGVFFKSGLNNAVLQQVWDSVPPSGNNPIAIDLNAFLPPNDAIPAPIIIDGAPPQTSGRRRYRYAGSLTTPDCAQTINWNLLTEPLAVGAGQIDQFRRWFPAGNARPIQPLYRRFVQLG
jgi:carbonic anhydrase